MKIHETKDGQKFPVGEPVRFEDLQITRFTAECPCGQYATEDVNSIPEDRWLMFSCDACGSVFMAEFF